MQHYVAVNRKVGTNVKKRLQMQKWKHCLLYGSPTTCLQELLFYRTLLDSIVIFAVIWCTFIPWFNIIVMQEVQALIKCLL